MRAVSVHKFKVSSTSILFGFLVSSVSMKFPGVFRPAGRHTGDVASSVVPVYGRTTDVWGPAGGDEVNKVGARAGEAHGRSDLEGDERQDVGEAVWVERGMGACEEAFPFKLKSCRELHSIFSGGSTLKT